MYENVRLVEFDLVLLLPEMNPATNDATGKPGEKYDNGIQRFIHPEKHFRPAPAGVGILIQSQPNTPRKR